MWATCILRTRSLNVRAHRAAAWVVQVDTDKFPDMKAMTAKAKSLGLKPGWYGETPHMHVHGSEMIQRVHTGTRKSHSVFFHFASSHYAQHKRAHFATLCA